MDVSVLIVTYQAAAYIERCLHSVFMQKNISYEIIVVDNASIDDTTIILRKFNDRIQLIENTENRGFGKANNQAFQQATGRFVFLLNPDARLTDPNALRHLVDFMGEHPQAGVVGTKIISTYDADKTTLPKNHYPDEQYIDSPFQHLPGKIAWILGASMMFPADVYRKLQGFDEAFFLYAEDADICLRARELGYEIAYFQDVVVEHMGGASEAMANFYDRTMRKEKAYHLFYVKHYGKDIALRLARKKYWRSLWRLMEYKVLCAFTSHRSWHEKHLKNKAIYDSSRQFERFLLAEGGARCACCCKKERDLS
ncbi:MAG: hypothetical protein A2X77_00800 [Gammaproteobacteria bacterium GWE2_42_36]|nr:MAG: hypothetical protein A2X77_00800 [Gammaproteobacteria bacterium GWE2_42_36]HCU05231.1 hypothetical protein [Coxiellaceae bacterium]